jgi:hypothetical protein
MEITEQLIVDRVLVIRGVKIMLDKDLAEIYGVKVKRLNEQVKEIILVFLPTLCFSYQVKNGFI